MQGVTHVVHRRFETAVEIIPEGGKHLTPTWFPRRRIYAAGLFGFQLFVGLLCLLPRDRMLFFSGRHLFLMLLSPFGGFLFKLRDTLQRFCRHAAPLSKLPILDDNLRGDAFGQIFLQAGVFVFELLQRGGEVLGAFFEIN